MLAQAAHEHSDNNNNNSSSSSSDNNNNIGGVDPHELAQNLGTMSLAEEKRKRRTVQLQLLMRETHKVASKNREQRLNACVWL